MASITQPFPIPSSNRMTEAGFWDHAHTRGVVPKDSWYRRLARRQFDGLLNGLLHESTAAPSVIELGCAPGRMLCRLNRLRSDCQYVGVDFSEYGLELTRQATNSEGMNVQVIQGDVFEVQVPQKFDIATSFGLVEHFTDTPSIIKQHARLCRPGGVVAVTIPNFSPCKSIAQVIAPTQAKAHNFEIMKRERLFDAMKAAGLENVEVGGFGGPRIWMETEKTRVYRHVYWRAAQAWNFFASLVPGSVTWDGNYWARGTVAA